MTRRIAVGLIALLITAQPTLAQANHEEPAAWRRWAFAAIGAGLLGGLGSFQNDPDQEDATTGICSTRSCILPVSAALGAGLGFLLGYEFDQRAQERYREGPTLDIPFRTIGVGAEPIRMLESPHGIVTMSREDIGLVDSSTRFRVLHAGLRPRSAAVIDRGNLLIVATNRAVIGLALPARALPDTLSTDGAASIAALDHREVALGKVGGLSRVSITGTPGSLSIQEEAAAPTQALPAAMQLSPVGGALWVASDSFLVARDPRSLAELGRVRLPGRASGLTVSGRSGLVTMGNDGAALLNLSDPRRPRLTSHLTQMDFAYGAATLDGRLYIAGGPQGVFVYDASSPDDPVPVGVIRAFGFAAEILLVDGRLHVLDREREQIAVLGG